ncbi:methyltransferase domain-containing protein [Solihabitans fulvus]|uniref:Methyltransferase domain-containing protein n=1 Tax=Solihabitans fulvus TaxID=1892852 RepID=A0A5B2X8R9_9PSEU|nr:methyltransferase domain-containing protein [Solihabitans fulvus]KAA2259536.1 methyltransferase domain-containing protein [Solihabitans fulvus]
MSSIHAAIDAAEEPGLPLTGERTVPGIAEENYWFRRHEAAYLALLPHCAGGTVLDAGCGEGYGAQLIAGTAARVLALDYDEFTAAHVARAYPDLAVLRGNLADLPVRSSSVDVVANFQVIEHLWSQEGFLAECARVLRPGGRLLVTTPNRLTFSPGRDTPLNPFHTRELAPNELAELLRGAGFRVELLAGLRHGPALRELDAANGGSIIDAQVAVAVAGTPWPADLLDAVKSVRSNDFEITGDDLDASLDLVAVAVAP